MKYYRFNQVAMAVLGALLLFFGARTIIHIMFEEHEEKPGYEVPGTEAKKPAEQKPSEANELATLLAKADPAKGAEVAKKCEICHNFEKGGPNMIGPNLYGVLGRKVASHEGYDYSDALKAKAAEIGNWSYNSVSAMDANPSAFVPGTKMALFQGLPDIEERADLLAFMRTKNDNPPPLPEVKAPAPGGEATTPAAPPAGNEFMAALASADPKAGEADVALCKVCHTFNKGGSTLVGPNLYGVVGRKIASEDGFNYTPGLKAHEGDWTFDKLDAWLTNPAAFAPGTMMAFPGIPDTKKRADVIAYLNSNSDSPLPIPKPGASGAPAGEKGAAAPAAAPQATPPAAAPEATPPAVAPEAAPSAKTPPAPAPEAAPSAETPPAPAPEAAPSAETPPTPAPEAAPSAETPPAPAPEAAPSAETPPAPSPEAAPSAETPPAPAPEAAPSAETPPAPAPEAAPSSEEPTLSNQPQPVYPNGAPDAQ